MKHDRCESPPDLGGVFLFLHPVFTTIYICFCVIHGQLEPYFERRVLRKCLQFATLRWNRKTTHFMFDNDDRLLIS